MSPPAWIEFGPPTLDRPFGLKLWPIFEHFFEIIKGYKPQDFRYIQGKTPLSTLPVCLSLLILYYAIIFGGRQFMKNRPPFQLNRIFQIHNLSLTCVSGCLVLLFFERMIPKIARRGLFYTICHPDGGWSKELMILYYINYLTKYVELFDTIFLCLKKKPLTFLHTYHHGATALLCYVQLIGRTSVSWIVICLNLMVHVVMYWYYFQCARGVKIWWKRYITIMQIAQFVIDLSFVYFASYTYFAAAYFPRLPNMGSCNGEEFAAAAGISILSSYLLLFISFYFSTYKKAAAAKSRARAAAKRALADAKKEGIVGVKNIVNVSS